MAAAALNFSNIMQMLPHMLDHTAAENAVAQTHHEHYRQTRFVSDSNLGDQQFTIQNCG